MREHFTDVEALLAADRFRVEKTDYGFRVQLAEDPWAEGPLSNRRDVERLFDTAYDRDHSFLIEVSHARGNDRSGR